MRQRSTFQKAIPFLAQLVSIRTPKDHSCCTNPKRTNFHLLGKVTLPTAGCTALKEERIFFLIFKKMLYLCIVNSREELTKKRRICAFIP